MVFNHGIGKCEIKISQLVWLSKGGVNINYEENIKWRDIFLSVLVKYKIIDQKVKKCFEGISGSKKKTCCWNEIKRYLT